MSNGPGAKEITINFPPHLQGGVFVFLLFFDFRLLPIPLY
jgi:hypothetical protein